MRDSLIKEQEMCDKLLREMHNQGNGQNVSGFHSSVLSGEAVILRLSGDSLTSRLLPCLGYCKTVHGSSFKWVGKWRKMAKYREKIWTQFLKWIFPSVKMLRLGGNIILGANKGLSNCGILHVWWYILCHSMI